MKFVSFIGAGHYRVKNYGTSDLISLIKDSGAARVIVALDPDFHGDSEDYGRALEEITSSEEVKGLISYAGVDETSYQSKKKELLQKYSSSAELVVKKNIMEMIETTIKSYLEGYWKDSDTVNSEVTDSLFRAKHKLISTMFWELEKNTWNAMLEELTEKVNAMAPGRNDLVLVDVEKKYWLYDKLGGE